MRARENLQSVSNSTSHSTQGAFALDSTQVGDEYLLQFPQASRGEERESTCFPQTLKGTFQAQSLHAKEWPHTVDHGKCFHRLVEQLFWGGGGTGRGRGVVALGGGGGGHNLSPQHQAAPVFSSKTAHGDLSSPLAGSFPSGTSLSSEEAQPFWYCCFSKSRAVQDWAARHRLQHTKSISVSEETP